MAGLQNCPELDLCQQGYFQQRILHGAKECFNVKAIELEEVPTMQNFNYEYFNHCSSSDKDESPIAIDSLMSIFQVIMQQDMQNDVELPM